MPFPPLIRRRLRRYAEEALAKETDQGWATLIFACLKYGKRVKLFDSAGCEACRQRRIQSSEWLMALEASNDTDKNRQRRQRRQGSKFYAFSPAHPPALAPLR